MSLAPSASAAQTVAPVSDRRYAAPRVRHRQIVTTCAKTASPPATTRLRLRVRISADNPNHHLWNNHGTWFLHYTVHPTPFTKERVRRSLGTPSLAAARERRDAIFAHLRTEAVPLQAVA
ncbi:MAG TPA: hypothetical protein VLW52_17895 [Opitutaceae bacterium]|nr:hypothetical protein [Opitutaceae bacterium]